MSEAEIPSKEPYGLELEAGEYWWCSCGRSANQPFCDGSHEGTNFTPIPFALKETRTVWLCGCKRSKTPPFCDGSHKEI